MLHPQQVFSELDDIVIDAGSAGCVPANGEKFASTNEIERKHAGRYA
jgi:hypothetical protein